MAPGSSFLGLASLSQPSRFVQCAGRSPRVDSGWLAPVWKSKFYDAFVLNHRVVLHAIDAMPARWRGDAGSSPLD